MGAASKCNRGPSGEKLDSVSYGSSHSQQQPIELPPILCPLRMERCQKDRGDRTRPYNQLLNL